MSDSELQRRLTTIFVEEVQERTRGLERDLLVLEKAEANDRVELLRALFRNAHSLKGAAGLVEIRPIEAACHWMEELFGAARDGRLDLDCSATELLLAATDAIAETGRLLSGDANPDHGPLDEVLPRLASLVSGTGDVIPVRQDDRDRSSIPSDQQTEQTGPEADDRGESATGRGSFIRVPAEQLDALLSQSGELLAARYRSRTRTDQITALQELTKSPRIQRWRMNGRKAPVRSEASPTAGSGSDQSTFRSSSRAQAENLANDGDLLLRLKDGLQQLAADLGDDYRIIENAATALDSDLRRARMQPFWQACEGLDRVVRDLGRSLSKSARLVIEGGEVEIDRSILQGLPDVLRHLVRNAVDHGLEPVADRRVAGKPDVGQITITAALRGDRVQVSVADDGRGLNVASIRQQARNRGIADTEDEREIIRQIFLPNLSTSPTVTQVSGRGVGLDIVKSTVERMRGAVDIAHQPGRGATFTLMLPLTLTTIRALLLSAGGQVFAIDSVSVDRLIRCSNEDVHSIEGRPAMLSTNGPMAVLELSDWLGLPARANHLGTGTFPAVVLNMLGKEIAILVDEVLAEQELVVRGLGPRLSGMRSYSGGTILSDGRVALVLNAAALAEAAIEHRPQRDLASVLGLAQPMPGRRVLVADDSVTIRTLQKSILEAAGYDVTVASDGAEAWQMLQAQGADLVVSDVEMPRMDGFVLTEAIRGSSRFKDLPVVLLTARETEQDKARGLQVGANGYLLKSAFDQRQLLETIAQLV